MTGKLSHTIGFDDAPFAPAHRGDVLVVGTVFSGCRLEGVISGRVRRDGANATRVLQRMVEQSRFRAHLQALLLQGIAMAGFNVIDIRALHETLGIAVLVVSRKSPDMAAVKRALITRVRGGERKWRLIERAGPMEPLGGLYVQRAGVSAERAERLISSLALHSALPEPLRAAHLIAAGVVRGESRHRA